MRTVALKAKIKGYVAEVRHLKSAKAKAKASAWKGRLDEMSRLTEERQFSRVQGRYLHLAYGYRRGVPYAAMERCTSDDYYQKKGVIKYTAQWAGTSEEKIEAWMKGEPEVQKSHKSARQLMAQMAR